MIWGDKKNGNSWEKGIRGHLAESRKTALLTSCPFRLLTLFLFLLRELQEHVVHQSKFLGLLSREVTIALRFFFDLVNRHAGVPGKDLVETAAVFQDFVSLNLNIGNLAA